MNSHTQYKNIVFEGGGVLGIAYCGAIDELRKNGTLDHIRNFAGTSAGAIIAGVMACGGTAEFISREIAKVNFDLMMDYGNKFYAMYNLVTYGGMCQGTVFYEWYGDMLEALTKNRDITFGQVHAGGKKLIVAAVNADTRELVYFNHKDNPDMPIRLAVRASMSIPFVFMPAVYNEHKYIDGGIMDNYPIRAFYKNGDHNPETLGLALIGTHKQVSSSVTGPISMLRAIMGCYLRSQLWIDPADAVNTIKISCGSISSMDFNIDIKLKTDLIEKGRRGVINHNKGTSVSNESAPILTPPMDIPRGDNIIWCGL
jgi:NTE family protein